MRKLMYLFSLALGLFVFPSCNYIKLNCKDCSCKQTISQTGVDDIIKYVEISSVCDQDLEGTTTFTQPSIDGSEQTVVQSCECRRAK